MTIDFQKMARGATGEMKTEETLRQIQDAMELDPQKIRFVAASYLATCMFNSLRESIVRSRADFLRDFGRDYDFVSIDIIGAAHVLSSAIQSYAIRTSPAPTQTLVSMMYELTLYELLVEDLARSIGKQRPDAR